MSKLLFNIGLAFILGLSHLWTAQANGIIVIGALLLIIAVIIMFIEYIRKA